MITNNFHHFQWSPCARIESSPMAMGSLCIPALMDPVAVCVWLTLGLIKILHRPPGMGSPDHQNMIASGGSKLTKNNARVDGLTGLRYVKILKKTTSPFLFVGSSLPTPSVFGLESNFTWTYQQNSHFNFLVGFTFAQNGINPSIYTPP